MKVKYFMAHIILFLLFLSSMGMISFNSIAVYADTSVVAHPTRIY